MTPEGAAHELRALLVSRARPDFERGMQRYFQAPIPALGVPNGEIAKLTYRWTEDHPKFTVAERLETADILVSQQAHHEEALAGFALLHRAAKRNLDAGFRDYPRRWLETSVSNWAQCDDLCIKLLYPFFLGHLDEIPHTRDWVNGGPWTRRAANVSVVKLVHAKAGKIEYQLPLSHVLDNATTLMADPEYYVQMGTGWLLKVAAQHHPDAIEEYLRTWHPRMQRGTFRYALEGLPPEKKAELMALGKGAIE